MDGLDWIGWIHLSLTPPTTRAPLCGAKNTESESLDPLPLSSCQTHLLPSANFLLYVIGVKTILDGSSSGGFHNERLYLAGWHTFYGTHFWNTFLVHFLLGHFCAILFFNTFWDTFFTLFWDSFLTLFMTLFWGHFFYTFLGHFL